MYTPSFKPRLEQKVQHSQRLQQMLQVLMMNNLDLESWILEEVEKNPLLEVEFPKKAPSSETILNESLYQISLYEHLLAQAQNRFSDRLSLEISKRIIGNLTPQGFFDYPIEDLAQELKVPLEKVEKVLQTIKNFDPLGIAAKDLQECILLQLREKKKEHTTIFFLIRDHFKELENQNFSLLQETYNLPFSKLLSFLQKELKPLRFAPASLFTREKNYALIPDLKAVKLPSKKWKAVCNESYFPRAHWKKEYTSLEPLLPEKEKAYFSSYKTKGNFFFQCLEKRRNTLEAIATYILQVQKDFLEQKTDLLPLSIKEIAQEVGVHISTVTRALYSKAIDTPRGVIPLKNLLSHAIPSSPEYSQKQAKEQIVNLISSEDKALPFSDEILAEKLKQKGILLSRRTIAKYRKELRIENHTKRKAKPF